MLIRKLTDYAVVILVFMGTDKSKLLSAAYIAEQTGIPLPTTSKILKILHASGLVDSRLGKQGGYSLAHDFDSLNLLQAVEAMEGPISITECADGGKRSHCVLENICLVHGQWSPVNEAICAALEGIALRDMVGKTKRKEVA